MLWEMCDSSNLGNTFLSGPVIVSLDGICKRWLEIINTIGKWEYRFTEYFLLRLDGMSYSGVMSCMQLTQPLINFPAASEGNMKGPAAVINAAAANVGGGGRESEEGRSAHDTLRE